MSTKLSATVMLLAAAVVFLMPTEVDAYGAAHVGYTHVGPNGVQHYGATRVNTPYGSYGAAHGTGYGAYGGGYRGYSTGGYGGAAYGGYHYSTGYGGSAYRYGYVR